MTHSLRRSSLLHRLGPLHGEEVDDGEDGDDGGDEERADGAGARGGRGALHQRVVVALVAGDSADKKVLDLLAGRLGVEDVLELDRAVLAADLRDSGKRNTERKKRSETRVGQSEKTRVQGQDVSVLR